MMAGMEMDDGPARVGSKRNYSRSGPQGGGAGRSHGNPQVCRYWQEGRCYKGEECQWLHRNLPFFLVRARVWIYAVRSLVAHKKMYVPNIITGKTKLMFS